MLGWKLSLLNFSGKGNHIIDAEDSIYCFAVYLKGAPCLKLNADLRILILKNCFGILNSDDLNHFLMIK